MAAAVADDEVMQALQAMVTPREHGADSDDGLVHGLDDEEV